MRDRARRNPRPSTLRCDGWRRVLNSAGHGAVAQLGERMTGSHEVRGSIPLSSTRNHSFILFQTIS